MAVDRRTRSEVFGAGFPVAASLFDLDEPIPPHIHDFIELAIITRGAVEHATAAGAIRLEPGDLVVIRPGSWHAYRPYDAAGFAVTNAYLGPELVHGRLSWLLDYPRLARLLLIGGRPEAALPAASRQRVAGWLSQLAGEPATGDARMKMNLLGCVLIEIATAAGAIEAGPPAITAPVRRAMQAMADDLACPWTITELAGSVGVSDSSLYRQFRNQLGSGPVEWLTRSRAECAATLLSQTDLSVAAIGRRVGWPDPSYASRRFRQVYELSPTAYRAAHTLVAPRYHAPGGR